MFLAKDRETPFLVHAHEQRWLHLRFLEQQTMAVMQAREILLCKCLCRAAMGGNKAVSHWRRRALLEAGG